MFSVMAMLESNNLAYNWLDSGTVEVYRKIKLQQQSKFLLAL